ncbi:MAG TPA: alpha/beta fold hydrolase [Candidatus Limnocylindrales bacterium]
MSRNKRSKGFGLLRLAFIVGAVGGFAASYRFALKYRERAGLPRRSPVDTTPEAFGLAYEAVSIPAGDHELSGWWVPAGGEVKKPRRRKAAAADGDGAATAAHEPPAPRMEPRPAIAVVHGWESNKGRTFAHVRYLHAAGFHCLVFDVRGHGDSPEETLPINVPEFAEDTAAAARWLASRPEVSAVGVLGHSMGAAGAIVAASQEPEIGAVVSLSAPADLVRMTRKTFEMAEMRVPAAIATPLAWFTAAVLLIPRRHAVQDASATAAAGRYTGPLLLIHGAQDHGVPVEHLEIIGRAAAANRGEDAPAVETLVLPDFGHRWLYEAEGCRRRIAVFFAKSLGGPVAPETAGDLAAACVVERPADPIYGFGALAGKATKATEKRIIEAD